MSHPTPKIVLFYFTTFSLWLAAVDPKTIARCPATDRIRQVALGATVLIPTITSAFAAGYAASTLSSNWLVIALPSVLFPFFVLSIDRVMLATFPHGEALVRKVFHFLLRFCLSILLGTAITHPLVLRLFEEPIRTVLAEQREARLTELRFEGAKEVALFDRQIAVQQALLQQLRTSQTESALELATPVPRSPEPQNQSVADQIGELDARVAAEQERLRELRRQIGEYEAEFDAEVAGKKSGIAGEGPRAKHIRETQLEWRYQSTEQIEGAISQLKKQRDLLVAALDQEIRLSSERRQYEFELRKTKEESNLEIQEAAQQTLKSQISGAVAELDRVVTAKAQHDSALQSRVSSLQNAPLPSGFVAQTLALHHLFAQGSEGHFALACFLFLTLLFIVLDTIPLVAKFTAPNSQYDRLMTSDDSDVETIAPVVEESHTPIQANRHVPDLSSMHPVWAARVLKQFQDSSPELSTNRELADAVGMTPQQVSTYFAVLKTPSEFQEQLLQIDFLSVDCAARVSRLQPTQRCQLLPMLHSNPTQGELKTAIQRIKNKP